MGQQQLAICSDCSSEERRDRAFSGRADEWNGEYFCDYDFVSPPEATCHQLDCIFDPQGQEPQRPPPSKDHSLAPSDYMLVKESSALDEAGEMTVRSSEFELDVPPVIAQEAFSEPHVVAPVEPYVIREMLIISPPCRQIQASLPSPDSDVFLRQVSVGSPEETCGSDNDEESVCTPDPQREGMTTWTPPPPERSDLEAAAAELQARCSTPCPSENYPAKHEMGTGCTAGDSTKTSEVACVGPSTPQLQDAAVSSRESEGNVKGMQCGDIVALGSGVPQEYHAHAAIVTGVAETHCTVVVLDDSRQVGIGECWPAFRDLSLESCTLRLGTQVVIDGMSGARTKHLNGLTGTISEHPREGHPSFIRKPSCPEKPRLTVCICFSDPLAARGRSALAEPRFLRPFDEVVLQTANQLGDTVAALSQSTSSPAASPQTTSSFAEITEDSHGLPAPISIRSTVPPDFLVESSDSAASAPVGTTELQCAVAELSRQLEPQDELRREVVDLSRQLEEREQEVLDLQFDIAGLISNDLPSLSHVSDADIGEEAEVQKQEVLARRLDTLAEEEQAAPCGL